MGLETFCRFFRGRDKRGRGGEREEDSGARVNRARRLGHAPRLCKARLCNARIQPVETRPLCFLIQLFLLSLSLFFFFLLFSFFLLLFVSFSLSLFFCYF